MQQTSAFTAVAVGLQRALKSPCYIAPAGASNDQMQEFEAIWDTGATNSSITQDVVGKCGLKSIGKVLIYHAGIEDDPDETDSYLVNIGLPNGVSVNSVPVSRGSFTGGDILLGMDIINTGDFAITHSGGNTKFTFQIPAQADIDFVKEPQAKPRNRAERRARSAG